MLCRCVRCGIMLKFTWPSPQAHDAGPDGGDTDSNQLGGSRTTVAAEAPWEREVSRDTVHLPDLSQVPSLQARALAEDTSVPL